jgi:ubiquinone/menaquinone biosynthesis C-methylase UbiE
MAFLYTFSTCLALLITGCWMLYGIKITKPRIALKMIQNLGLKGHEKVLDLGCGRGLLLCEVAKHLPHGEVLGIDLWSAKDQSGNTLAKTLENADREGIRERVNIHTGDVRALPFPDGTFDAVVSSLCLHNIGDKTGREQALLEMLRILKPGGKFAIADIQRSKEYTEFLIAQGINVEYSKPNYSYCPSITTVEGRKP